MQTSKIWTKLSELSWVRKIMNDIMKTLASKKDSEKLINMSAWNPIVLDELCEMWTKHSNELINSSEYAEVIWRYWSTKWYAPFIETIINYIDEEFSHKIISDNVLITPGTQSLYFYAINIFGWAREDWSFKKIYLVQNPDYTWYQWMAMNDDLFISNSPKFTKTWKHSYKYEIDFDNMPDKSEVWAILLSRPCNPTWNVVLDSEMDKLKEYVKWSDIPVFLDSAYWTPIPNLSFRDMKTDFHENLVYWLSLSKAWLPWERVWIAIWDEKFLKPLESFQSNSCISSSKFGQALANRAISSWDLKKISKDIINSYYKSKFDILNECISEYMPDNVPYYTHETEWSMFAFIWFEWLPISDEELYEILKTRWVLFVPGNSFFSDDSKHSRECLRISVTVSDEEIRESIQILAEEIKKVYKI